MDKLTAVDHNKLEYRFNTFIKYMLFNAGGRSVRPKHVAGVDGADKISYG
jgi:hypothetical protein